VNASQMVNRILVIQAISLVLSWYNHWSKTTAMEKTCW